MILAAFNWAFSERNRQLPVPKDTKMNRKHAILQIGANDKRENDFLWAWGGTETDDDRWITRFHCQRELREGKDRQRQLLQGNNPVSPTPSFSKMAVVVAAPCRPSISLARMPVVAIAAMATIVKLFERRKPRVGQVLQGSQLPMPLPYSRPRTARRVRA